MNESLIIVTEYLNNRQKKLKYIVEKLKFGYLVEFSFWESLWTTPKLCFEYDLMSWHFLSIAAFLRFIQKVWVINLIIVNIIHEKLTHLFIEHFKVSEQVSDFVNSNRMNIYNRIDTQ